MNTTAFYTRPATHNLNQFARINEAYKLAGLTPPTYVEDLKRTINSAPTVQQEAASIAQEALNADEPTEFYESAIERIQRAQAADILKQAFARNIQSALDSQAHHCRTTAAEDLAPAFNKIAKTMSTAAAKLPAGAPLDMATNIEAGTGTEYKTTRDALAQLGTYAALYPQGTPTDGVPSALHAVLPIVALPATTVERIKANVGIEVVTSNQAQLSATHVVRKLTNDLATNTDNTLASIAAGNYEGVTISLATPEQLAERRKHAVNAYKRITEQHTSGSKVVAF